MAEDFIQCNVSITSEDTQALDRMMVDDGYENRSAFIRRLVRQEYARRFSQPSSVTVEQALAAAGVSK